MFEIPPSLLQFMSPPASADAIRTWSSSGRPLPTDAQSFYGLTNGLELAPIGTDVLSLEAATQYREQLNFHPISQLLSLLPITESNDSNPYCLIIGERLCGSVLLLSHDGDVCVSHNSLGSFLQALGLLIESDGESIDELAAGAIDDARIVADADHLLSEAFGQVESNWDALLPLVSACGPAMLVRLLEADDMWVREAAAIRCGRTRCEGARASLTKLAGAGSSQDNHAARRSLGRLNGES